MHLEARASRRAPASQSVTAEEPMQHTHAFPEPPGPTWQPVSDVTPIFQRFRPDELTLKALTLTQVELHQLRMAHSQLAQQANKDRQLWAQQTSDMEDRMRQLYVRGTEAERLFNDHMESLMSLLQDKQQQLAQIQQEHDLLKGNSAGLIQALKQKLQDLQRSCEELQARKEQLQEELHNAGVSVEQGRRAQQRVTELEAAIDATQHRAQEMLGSLEKQRQEVELQRDQLQERLQSTQGALQRESERRSHSEAEALQLAVQRQQLSNALEVERLINAPLYDTDYATTTLAHVMRSAAAPTVASHSTAPRSPARQPGPLNPDAVTVSHTGPLGGVLSVRRPVVTLVERDLTRLGRSWATTTPTAGRPHPVYPDNIDRYREQYERAGAQRPYRARASSAPRAVRGGVAARSSVLAKGSPVFLTPQQRRTKPREEDAPSLVKTLKY